MEGLLDDGWARIGSSMVTTGPRGGAALEGPLFFRLTLYANGPELSSDERRPGLRAASAYDLVNGDDMMDDLHDYCSR